MYCLAEHVVVASRPCAVLLAFWFFVLAHQLRVKPQQGLLEEDPLRAILTETQGAHIACFEGNERSRALAQCWDLDLILLYPFERTAVMLFTMERLRRGRGEEERHALIGARTLVKRLSIGTELLKELERKEG